MIGQSICDDYPEAPSGNSQMRTSSMKDAQLHYLNQRLAKKQKGRYGGKTAMLLDGQFESENAVTD
jgi:hypothetical protein